MRPDLNIDVFFGGAKQDLMFSKWIESQIGNFKDATQNLTGFLFSNCLRGSINGHKGIGCNRNN